MTEENRSGSGNDSRIPGRGDRRGDRRVDREEQGDLLADAVTGFFGGAEPEPEDETVDEEIQAKTQGESQPSADPPSGLREPLALGLGDEAVSPPRGVAVEDEAEVIPESLWEQKMAWANQRSRDGRQDEAEELYKELVKDAPDNVRALNKRIERLA